MKVSRVIFFVYHIIWSSRNPGCRFVPTCSQYFLEATEKYGFPQGFFLATKRILTCHPFSKKQIYDPS